MEKKQIVNWLEKLLEREEGTLALDTLMEDLEEWDSLRKLSLMVMAKKEYGKELTAMQIRDFITINDICEELL